MKSILILTFFVFILTSCFNKSNVYEEVENKTNFQEEKINNSEKVELVQEKIEEISKEKLIKDIRTIEWWKNLKEKIEEVSKFKTPREVDKLLILKSTVWKHWEVTEAKQKYCDKLKRDIYCLKFNANFIIEELVDQDNQRIFDKNDLWIELDWKELDFKHMFKTDLNYEMNHLLRVTKKWYVWFYKTFYSWKITPENKFRIEPKVQKYTYSQNIKSSEQFWYKTKNYEFIIEPDTFVYKTWEAVLWNIDLYLFDISGKYLSITTLNKYDKDTLSYLWRWIENTSLALVRAYKWNKELKINKPIRVLSNLNNVNSENEYTDFIPLNKNLTQEEKVENNLPFIWNLDESAWIWFTTDLKVLNKELDIEFTLN